MINEKFPYIATLYLVSGEKIWMECDNENKSHIKESFVEKKIYHRFLEDREYFIDFSKITHIQFKENKIKDRSN